jgi:hypothetical protein
MNALPPNEEPPDELTAAYRRLSSADESRPSAQVRAAIQARATLAVAAQNRATAANEHRWQWKAAASVAVAGLVGLIAWHGLHRQIPLPTADLTAKVAQGEFNVSEASSPNADLRLSGSGAEPSIPALAPSPGPAARQNSPAPLGGSSVSSSKDRTPLSESDQKIAGIPPAEMSQAGATTLQSAARQAQFTGGGEPSEPGTQRALLPENPAAPPVAILSDERRASTMGADFAQSCPHAAEQLKAAATARRQHQPAIEKVTRPALQHELLLMADSDQAARLRWDPSMPMPEEVSAIDRHNLARLEQILDQDGFPTAAMVGYNGVNAAWLLLQHVPEETNLRTRWLPVIIARAKSGELASEDLALMTDRTLLSSGKPQRYGSQALFKDGEFIVRPTEDPEHLDDRRKSLGLIPEADYLCLLRSYTLGQPGSGSTK